MPDSFSMAAQANALEARIRANRLLDLPVPWADELVFPAYNGLAINNIAQSIAALLGAELPAGSPLDETVWGPEGLPQDINRVVLFISDGLGYQWLQELLAEDPALAESVADLSGGRGPLPLTSITPSSTTIALPTYWTGVPPAQHGIVGTRLFLRELAMYVHLLHFKPQMGRHPRDVLADWGIDPAQFVPDPTLGEALAAVEVPTHLLILKDLAHSGLSRIMHRGANHFHIQAGYADFWLRAADILTATAGQRCYVNIYWPAVDTLSHQYGAHSDYVRAEIKAQLAGLRRVLADPVVQDGRTLVLVAADHGHADLAHKVYLTDDPRARPIFEAMRGGFGAETRLPYLYIRASQCQAVTETIRQHFGEGLACVDGETFVQAGLLGDPATLHPEVMHRVGDVVVIPRQGWGLLDNFRNDRSISRHGGLSAAEMLVPFLWRRI